MTGNTDRSCLPCPCCGSLTIGEHGQYEICEVCGWEDDPTQSANPEEGGGANQESLRVAQARWSLASDKLDICFAKASGCDRGACSCGESDDCLAKGWEKFVPAQTKQPAQPKPIL